MKYLLIEKGEKTSKVLLQHGKLSIERESGTNMKNEWRSGDYSPIRRRRTKGGAVIIWQQEEAEKEQTLTYDKRMLKIQ